MKDREPYNLKRCIRFYNCFQVVSCSWFIAGGWYYGLSPKYLFKCENFSFLTDYQRLNLYIGIWLFLGLRMLELIETVFFVLRKKFNQASFLHIFHHIGSALMTWLCIAMHAGNYILLIAYYQCFTRCAVEI